MNFRFYYYTTIAMPYYFFAGKSDNNGKTNEWMSKIAGQGCYTFPLESEPKRFKSGTLDQLMALTEILNKQDLFIEGLVKKVLKMLEDTQQSKADSNILWGGQKYPIEQFFGKFAWEDSKFPRSKSIVELISIILEKVNQMDNQLKKSYADFTETKNMLISYQKKSEGNYLSRDLLDVLCSEAKVNPNDFIDSHYLCTAIAILNKNQVEIWKANYEKIELFEYVDKGTSKPLTCSVVVPGSSKFLDMADKEGNQLYRVVLLRKHLPQFIASAKSKHKIIVREFKYDKVKYDGDKKKKEELSVKLKSLETAIIKSCEAIYSDMLLASMHMKSLRVHVESVLRWGIPPKYFTCIIKPALGKDKILFKNLIMQFAETKDLKVYGSKEEISESEDYYPFILVQCGAISG